MPTYHKLLLYTKTSYKETAELSMESAADEVRNLVISEKGDTVNNMIVQQMKMPTLMLMIVILMRE